VILSGKSAALLPIWNTSAQQAVYNKGNRSREEVKKMKFSAVRQHKKINSNCEKLMCEYLEELRIGNENRATTIRRRIQSRYGKDIFQLMGVLPDEDNE